MTLCSVLIYHHFLLQFHNLLRGLFLCGFFAEGESDRLEHAGRAASHFGARYSLRNNFLGDVAKHLGGYSCASNCYWFAIVAAMADGVLNRNLTEQL